MMTGNMYDEIGFAISAAGAVNHRLEKYAEIKAGQDFNRGAIVSLDSDGKFQAGCGAGSAANRPMPMIAKQASDAYTVQKMDNNIVGGNLSAMPCIGGYELMTTEYVADTYNPNDLLTAADGTDAGKVKKATAAPYGAQMVCGCVSDGVANEMFSGENQAVLKFWTMFLPAGS